MLRKDKFQTKAGGGQDDHYQGPKKVNKLLIGSFFGLVVLACFYGRESSEKFFQESLTSFNKIIYPVELAPRGDTVDEYLSADGETVIKVEDPYRFLEERDSEATKKWVEAENKITTDFLDTCELRDKIKSKFREYFTYSQIDVPEKHGDHYYFGYNDGT